MKKRTLQNDHGAALVELALTLPLLCLVLIGSVELGRMAYAAIEVSHAARAAVAYGSQNHLTAAPANFDNIRLAASQDAADLASMGATLVTTPSDACVCYNSSSSTSVAISDCTTLAQLCCPPNETTNCGSGYSIGTGIVYMRATTTATLNTIFHYPGIPTSFTLNGFAQMRVVEN